MIVNTSQGKLIALEGIDGSGISTQILRLKYSLETKQGIKVVNTKEPSEGPIGTTIRQVLSGRLTGIDDHTLALLFAADRIDHNQEKIKPLLEKGNVVLCDRYIWSSLAYQGIKNPIVWLEELNKYAIKPDLTVFIKVRPEVSISRILRSRYKTEIYEKQDILQKVMNNYINIIERWGKTGKRIVIIDGEQSQDIVEKEIYDQVTQYLNKN